jgi:hypothetical protein
LPGINKMAGVKNLLKLSGAADLTLQVTIMPLAIFS